MFLCLKFNKKKKKTIQTNKMNETEGFKSQYCGQSLDEFHTV